jgi:hypothetical protein
VRPTFQKRGIGTELLGYLESKTDKPLLIGTWADAIWAVPFYRKKGYRLLPEEEKNRLLHPYSTIPERQVETSVVLVNDGWFNAALEAGKARE